MTTHDHGSTPDGTGAPRQGGSPGLQFGLGQVLIVLVLLTVFQLSSRPHADTLTYSEFKTLLGAGRVRDVLVGQRSISGQFVLDSIAGLLPAARVAELRAASGARRASPHPFVTTRVEDPALVTELQAAKVRFAGRAENPWLSALLTWLLPGLLLFWIMGRGMQRMGGHGGLMAIGKSKARVYMERTTGVTFEDVAGIDEARAELMEIVDFLRDPERYRRLGGKIPKGVLLVGGPGTGKTLLAKAVAGEAKVPFFSLTGSDFVEMFVGVGAARVRDLFQQAEAAAPSIIFIDELDALGRSRSAATAVSGNDEREQTLNQLLAQMDGFDTSKGVMILAATNRPEILDPALLRPGRFDRKVVVDRPDVRGREQILRVHTRGVTLSPAVDLGSVAARTVGFVGADLANLVNEAALLAARAGKDVVEMADFEEAIDRVVAGLEHRSRVMNAGEKEIVAHHEAGHALIAELRPKADRVAKISIIPRGVAALGYTQQQPAEDRYLLTRTELLDRLDVMLGGRAAEELVFSDVSTGAQDDLQRATDLARDMVMRYGMSEGLGLASYEGRHRPLFIAGAELDGKEYSDDTAREIDAEVRNLLDAAHRRACATLEKHERALRTLARLLIEKEVVDRAMLAVVLEEAATLAAASPEAIAVSGTAPTIAALPGSGVEP
ncbi:MAG TPA: ATP-dependent zinc metalloprotease FtsH [Longimicrobiaceae bacterium]|nr:ATP-dependent zinc metalloprotease FtsH [Longimicrobiaceae bacterium]